MMTGWKKGLAVLAIVILLIEVLLAWHVLTIHGVLGSVSHFVQLIFSDPWLSFIMLDLLLAYAFLTVWLFGHCREQNLNPYIWILLLWTVGTPVLMYYLIKYYPTKEIR